MIVRASGAINVILQMYSTVLYRCGNTERVDHAHATPRSYAVFGALVVVSACILVPCRPRPSGLFGGQSLIGRSGRNHVMEAILDIERTAGRPRRSTVVNGHGAVAV